MTAPTLLVMPGASLMEITTVTGGFNVRCPGCGESLHVRHGEARSGGSLGLAHEDDCPVYAQIQDAIERYEHNVVRYG